MQKSERLLPYPKSTGKFAKTWGSVIHNHTDDGKKYRFEN